MAQNHPNIAKIVGYTNREESNICGKNQVLDIYSEWYEHDLELEILERVPKKVLVSTYFIDFNP